MSARRYARSPSRLTGRRRRSAANCAVMAPAPAAIIRSRLTGPRRCAAPGYGPPSWRLIRICSRRSKTFWHNAGARPRSAAHCAESSPIDRTGTLHTGDDLPGAYRPNSLLLRRPAPSPLRTGRDHRRAHIRFTRRRRHFGEPSSACTSARSLPRTALSPATGKATSSSARSRSAIGALVERHTRYVKLTICPDPTRFGGATGCCASRTACPRCCFSRSPGIKAASWPATSSVCPFRLGMHVHDQR